MNEWLKIMLEEIRRKRAEAEAQRREHERRDRQSAVRQQRSDRSPGRDRGD